MNSAPQHFDGTNNEAKRALFHTLDLVHSCLQANDPRVATGGYKVLARVTELCQHETSKSERLPNSQPTPVLGRKVSAYHETSAKELIREWALSYRQDGLQFLIHKCLNHSRPKMQYIVVRFVANAFGPVLNQFFMSAEFRQVITSSSNCLVLSTLLADYLQKQKCTAKASRQAFVSVVEVACETLATLSAQFERQQERKQVEYYKGQLEVVLLFLSHHWLWPTNQTSRILGVLHDCATHTRNDSSIVISILAILSRACEKISVEISRFQIKPNKLLESKVDVGQEINNEDESKMALLQQMNMIFDTLCLHILLPHHAIVKSFAYRQLTYLLTFRCSHQFPSRQVVLRIWQMHEATSWPEHVGLESFGSFVLLLRAVARLSTLCPKDAVILADVLSAPLVNCISRNTTVKDIKPAVQVGDVNEIKSTVFLAVFGTSVVQVVSVLLLQFTNSPAVGEFVVQLGSVLASKIAFGDSQTNAELEDIAVQSRTQLITKLMNVLVDWTIASRPTNRWVQRNEKGNLLANSNNNDDNLWPSKLLALGLERAIEKYNRIHCLRDETMSASHKAHDQLSPGMSVVHRCYIRLRQAIDQLSTGEPVDVLLHEKSLTSVSESCTSILVQDSNEVHYNESQHSLSTEQFKLDLSPRTRTSGSTIRTETPCSNTAGTTSIDERAVYQVSLIFNKHKQREGQRKNQENKKKVKANLLVETAKQAFHRDQNAWRLQKQEAVEERQCLLQGVQSYSRSKGYNEKEVCDTCVPFEEADPLNVRVRRRVERNSEHWIEAELAFYELRFFLYVYTDEHGIDNTTKDTSVAANNGCEQRVRRVGRAAVDMLQLQQDTIVDNLKLRVSYITECYRKSIRKTFHAFCRQSEAHSRTVECKGTFAQINEASTSLDLAEFTCFLRTFGLLPQVLSARDVMHVFHAANHSEGSNTSSSSLTYVDFLKALRMLSQSKSVLQHILRSIPSRLSHTGIRVLDSPNHNMSALACWQLLHEYLGDRARQGNAPPVSDLAWPEHGIKIICYPFAATLPALGNELGSNNRCNETSLARQIALEVLDDVLVQSIGCHLLLPNSGSESYYEPLQTRAVAPQRTKSRHRTTIAKAPKLSLSTRMNKEAKQVPALDSRHSTQKKNRNNTTLQHVQETPGSREHSNADNNSAMQQPESTQSMSHNAVNPDGNFVLTRKRYGGDTQNKGALHKGSCSEKKMVHKVAFGKTVLQKQLEGLLSETRQKQRKEYSPTVPHAFSANLEAQIAKHVAKSRQHLLEKQEAKERIERKMERRRAQFEKERAIRMHDAFEKARQMTDGLSVTNPDQSKKVPADSLKKKQRSNTSSGTSKNGSQATGLLPKILAKDKVQLESTIDSNTVAAVKGKATQPTPKIAKNSQAVERVAIRGELNTLVDVPAVGVEEKTEPVVVDTKVDVSPAGGTVNDIEAAEPPVVVKTDEDSPPAGGTGNDKEAAEPPVVVKTDEDSPPAGGTGNDKAASEPVVVHTDEDSPPAGGTGNDKEASEPVVVNTNESSPPAGGTGNDKEASEPVVVNTNESSPPAGGTGNDKAASEPVVVHTDESSPPAAGVEEDTPSSEHLTVDSTKDKPLNASITDDKQNELLDDPAVDVEDKVTSEPNTSVPEKV